MNILNKLSVKSLKLNKKRTVSTIIGIVLSVALICAVATMVTSFQETLIQNSINETGYYHLELKNITDEDISKLKNNRDIQQIKQVNKIADIELESSQNEKDSINQNDNQTENQEEEDSTLQVYSMSNETLQFLKFKLKEGRFAQNENEIVISKYLTKDKKFNYKIGDTIKLSKEKEFTIVGIIERPTNANGDDYNPRYTGITTNVNSENKLAYITLQNPKDYKAAICNILGASDYNKISAKLDENENLKYKNFTINTELLRWEVFAFSDKTVTMLYGMVAIVIFVIIFTSVFCIRNSFAIATTEKIKMYGMLASVGATKKQIRKNVIFEAMLLGIIGIPVGIFCGILATFILVQIVNALIGSYLLSYVDGLILNISIVPIIVSIILGIITIYFSAISSARKASKVSPIEQLRNSGEIKIKNRKLKTPKIISKVFKTGGVLAYKNLKRSSKKYRTTVISFAVSICIFITMNSFIANMLGQTETYYKDYDYNIQLNNLSEVSDETIKSILSYESVENYYMTYEDNGGSLKIRDIRKINNDDNYPLIEENKYNNETGEFVKTGEKCSYLNLVGLDSQTFKKYIEKIGENYDEVKTSGILCDYFYYIDSKTDDTKQTRRYKYEKNDTIYAKYGEENKDLQFKVGGITETKPYGYEDMYYDGGLLVVDINQVTNMNFERYGVFINSNNPDKLEEEIKNLKTNIYVGNIASTVKEQDSMMLIVQIFLYGFIIVITLIGVTNIFNTITSNMELRQKEFAMLKSVGMTRKEFNRMINLETIFYSVKALIYGIIFGLLGTFALYKAASVKIDYGMYVPVIPILISIVAVFVLVFVIMRYSIRKIGKQNVIETIRNENV